jgi:hypothetical protein
MVLPITKPQSHCQNLRLCISSNPFFTQKTITSSVGGCTFVRISGKFDYPNKYTDPDGKWVYNNSNKTVIARTGQSDYIFIGTGKTYMGRIDGIITQDGTIFKISELEGGILRNTNIVVNEENGTYSFDFSDLGSVAINSIGDLAKSLINISNKVRNKKDVEYSGTYYNMGKDHPSINSWWASLTNENEMGNPEEWDKKYSEQLSKQWENAFNGKGEFPVGWETND